MIVSCPACSARYKIDSSKIKGRGAKITCPRCAHKFVVYKDRSPSRSAEPATQPLRSTTEILTRDFRRVGVTWRVRRSMGVTYSFHDLETLRRHLNQGKVQAEDSLSYDARTWVPIDSIDDLDAYFEDTWRKAERGEIGPAPRSGRTDVPDEDEEGPTTIMGHGHALMDDIRKAVAEATTPPPSPSRLTNPGRPTGLRSREVREAYPDDPTTFSRRSPVSMDDLTPSSQDVRAAAPIPLRAPTPTPGGTHSPAPSVNTEVHQEVQRDNGFLLVTSIMAILLVLVVVVLAAWIAGLVEFGPQEPVAPPSPSAMPAQPDEPAAPAAVAPPADVTPGTDAPAGGDPASVAPVPAEGSAAAAPQQP
jgi:predicted Zn finger-like uncharacterized protein